MTAPVWVTPPGDLGTVVEGEFYQIQLDATNSDSFTYLSGVLPVGIRVTSNGILEGNPKNYDYIQGVPVEVAQDVTSKFVVRATSSDGTVADRVFEMTVTGQDAPSIDSTPLPDLGTYFDGDRVDVQLTATDPDPEDLLTWRYQSGTMPSGVAVNSTGRISGYIDPFTDNDGTPGFDAVNFDMAEWDFRTKSVDKLYEFIVEVSDSKQVDVKSYNIYGISRNAVSADTDAATADLDATTVSESDLTALDTSSTLTSGLYEVLDASQTNLRVPALLTESTGLGRISHDNRFNFQFVGRDFDGDAIDYILDSGSLPTGLSLDTQSGWMTGTIPNLSATETTFTFAIKVRKRSNTEYVSAATSFTMTVVGNADSVVTWPTSDLTLITGEQCQLDVIADISDGRPVQYELKSGSTKVVAGNFVIGETYTIVTSGTTDFISIGSADNTVGTVFTATGTGAGTGTASLGTNKLPQGLRLNEDGLIVGRASFEKMMFDTGDTTFDVANLYTNETTFEQVYSFVVRVYSADGVVDTYKKFTITIDEDTNKPYESLFARALPPQAQRDIYDSIIQNNDDIPFEDVYRASDYAFGVQTDIRALIATGLAPKSETDYIEAMSKNFWNNTFRFGGFKTARALNTDGTVKYEVVYVELIDNKQGVDPETGLSASPALRQDVRSNVSTWTNPLAVSESMPDVSHGHYLASQANDYYVYPNSIENMRSRLKSEIGYQVLERKVLPDWMKDKQSDNTVLGWILACPLVFCKPDTSAKIKYRLEERVKTASLDLKKISFEVDRFILDNNLSEYYSSAGENYLTTVETSFDVSATTTTFDGDGTRFFAYVDVYTDKDEGDTYLKFTQTGPFDRLPYTER
tara:strand:+ start:512 stop:3094 length:2583 start_codon:yes stop_codon:yes gene_type:complete